MPAESSGGITPTSSTSTLPLRIDTSLISSLGGSRAQAEEDKRRQREHAQRKRDRVRREQEGIILSNNNGGLATSSSTGASSADVVVSNALGTRGGQQGLPGPLSAAEAADATHTTMTLQQSQSQYAEDSRGQRVLHYTSSSHNGGYSDEREEDDDEDEGHGIEVHNGTAGMNNGDDDNHDNDGHHHDDDEHKRHHEGDVHGEGEEEEEEEEEEDDDDELSSSPSIPDEHIDFDLVYALHTFLATVEGQASVVKGDQLTLLDDSNSYWWLVRVLKTQAVGYIPAENIETPFERLARLNKHRNVDVSQDTIHAQQACIRSKF